ncbi:hypothetical protein H5410_001486 [Solanum commersonii]|uniref:Uncharacterized protein n=1 Tax=Solanum commersonii TaxID=4109 RepID=A0A9J6AZC6_SOLCO|nr:hypothetical protein H5410_001486 [Solanum commersonii]
MPIEEGSFMLALLLDGGPTGCYFDLVIGANKGIGFKTVKQLANSSVTVVLTARDEKRGTEATSLLNEQGFSNVVFHQLDVNNAGASGVVPDEDVQRAMNMDLVDWMMLPSYSISKVSLNAYTQILARRYPKICINCVHPGFVNTNITWHT